MDEATNSIKNVRTFWKEKVRSAESEAKSQKAPVRTRSHEVSSRVTSGNCKKDDKISDKIDEAERNTKEELIEVLKQRRESSCSPQPYMTSSCRSRPDRLVKPSSTDDHELVHDSNFRDPRGSWKKTTNTAPLSTDVEHSSTGPFRPRIGLTRSPSLGPLPVVTPPTFKDTRTHNSSTVAKGMAERTSKSMLKPHRPLRPASSVGSTKQSRAPFLPLTPLKKRPFSTSASDVTALHSDNGNRQTNIDIKVHYMLQGSFL